MSTDEKRNLPIIGSTEYVEIANIKDVPAKIDTGADSSAIWASGIKMEKDGTLIFSLFDEKSPFYTGERIKTKEYKAKVVRSSHGDEQVRYQVKLPLKLNDKSFDATFTLANRARNHFPILIGRRTIKGNFIVDVVKSEVSRQSTLHSKQLNQELQENPYEFHQKYMEKGEQ